MTWVYANGLPFDNTLAENIKQIYERVRNKKASIIIIDGGLGEGKTTMLIHLLDYINSLQGIKQQEVINSPQYSMGGQDFLNKLKSCYEAKLPCIGYDEAGDFSKRGAMSSFNAMLNRTFDTFRAFKMLVILVLPHIDCIDTSILDKNLVRLNIRCLNRTANSGNYKGYSLYRIELLKHRFKKYKIKNYAYKTVQANIQGHFKNLPPERCALLDSIGTKGKIGILDKASIRMEGLYAVPEMAIRLFRSEIWLRKQFKMHNFKPAKVVGKKHYYDQTQFETLRSISERTSGYVHAGQTKEERKKIINTKAE